jgi:pimeloyl-ACP methyl ester carboxylesterase
MTRFLQTLCIDRAYFAGASMGAAVLLQVAASGEQPWPIAGIVVVSGGGFVPLNAARRKALAFDCTLESMRSVVSTYVRDQSLLDDPMMVQARFESAIRPGAWEAIMAVRFKSPIAEEPRSDFGNEDRTPYEGITVPTLLIAGSEDQLRDPGYAEPVAARIPDCELHVFERCGHLPNIEDPDRFNRTMLEFLSRRYPT